MTRLKARICGSGTKHAVAVVALAAAAGWAVPPATIERRAPGQEEEFRWRGRLAAGKAIEIKDVNGDVRAEAAAGDEVEVVATKRARKSDPGEVKIEVVEHAGGVTICAVYPSKKGRRPNECRPGEGGRMNVEDNDVHVEFTVRVPREVRFTGRTVNGSIEAKSLGADVEAYSVNGSVAISTAGAAQAETVNGSIRASLGSASGSEPLEFRTVNGGIRLELPAEVGAQVRAETLNGDISTDFPLEVEGRFNRNRLSGTIGGGGRELRLTTVNGSIQLRRAS